MTSVVNSSPIACRGKLNEVLFQALGMHSDREHHGQPVANSTGTRTAVPQPCVTLGVPPASYPVLCYLLASIIASILVIFLANMIALQVSFSTKKKQGNWISLRHQNQAFTPAYPVLLPNYPVWNIKLVHCLMTFKSRFSF